MFNILLSGVISSLIFGFLVFYSKIHDYSQDIEMSKKQAIEAAKYEAFFIVKMCWLVHGFIFLLFLFI